MESDYINSEDDNGNVDGRRKKKKEPGKRCTVMFCNKTNADGVTLHQFPKNEKIRRQWISFVQQKRDPSGWRAGSGHICSDHFTPEDYHGYGLKLAGLATKLVLKTDAIPSKQVVPTPDQLAIALRKKRKLPTPEEKSKVGVLEDHTTPKRTSRAVAKLTANRLVKDFERACEEKEKEEPVPYASQESQDTMTAYTETGSTDTGCVQSPATKVNKGTQ